jgi:AhpD family alkylhydroperoxidase
MAWLSLPADAASAELERLTEPWRRRGDQVPPVMGVLKRSPRAFAAVLELNYALAFGASSLGRRREELIAVWVSALNDCFFCLATHARYLEQAWTENGAEFTLLLGALHRLSPRLRAGDEGAWGEIAKLPGLEKGESELLAFITGLTLSPEANAHSDFTRLQLAGHTETEILDGVLVASCFAFMNRLACGTGVALDPQKHAAAERLFGRAELERHIAWAAVHASE